MKSRKQLLLEKIRSDPFLTIDYIMSWAIPNWKPLGKPHRHMLQAFEKVRKQKELVAKGLLKPKDAKEGVIVLFPRSHGKTNTTLGYVLYLLGHNPNLKIKIICESEELAKKRIMALKTHIEKNPRLHELFPDLVPADQESWSAQKIYVKRSLISPDPSVEAYGVLSAATGSHCSILICDDIIGQKNALVYPENLKKVEEAFYNTWLNVLEEPEGWFIYLFTPYRKGELSLKLKERTDIYEVVEYVIDENLNPIWPELVDRDALIKKREKIGATAFARAYQGKVASDEDFLFPKHLIEKCYDPELRFGEYPENSIFVMGVDLQSGRTSASARNVLFTLAVDENGKRIPVSIKVGRWDSVTTAKLILAEYEKYNHELIFIENNAYQQALIDWLEAISGNVDLPIQGYRTGAQKFDPNKGLPSMAAEFEKGLWRIPMKEPHPDDCKCGLCVWIEELTNFPHAKFSDTVMASFFAREAVKQIVGDEYDLISFIHTEQEMSQIELTDFGFLLQ